MSKMIWSRGRILNGILVLFLFFMPWMELSCGGTRLFRTTGAKMATGFEFVDPGSSMNSAFSMRPDEASKKKMMKVAGWPLLFLVPAAALLLIGFGVAKSRRDGRHRLASILSGLAFAAMVIKMVIETGELERQSRQADGLLRLDWQPAFWLSLLLLGGWTLLEWWAPKAVEVPSPESGQPAPELT